MRQITDARASAQEGRGRMTLVAILSNFPAPHDHAAAFSPTPIEVIVRGGGPAADSPDRERTRP